MSSLIYKRPNIVCTCKRRFAFKRTNFITLGALTSPTALSAPKIRALMRPCRSFARISRTSGRLMDKYSVNEGPRFSEMATKHYLIMTSAKSFSMPKARSWCIDDFLLMHSNRFETTILLNCKAYWRLVALKLTEAATTKYITKEALSIPCTNRMNSSGKNYSSKWSSEKRKNRAPFFISGQTTTILVHYWTHSHRF